MIQECPGKFALHNGFALLSVPPADAGGYAYLVHAQLNGLLRVERVVALHAVPWGVEHRTGEFQGIAELAGETAGSALGSFLSR